MVSVVVLLFGQFGAKSNDLYYAAHGSELLFLFETLRWVEPDFFKIPW